MGRRAIRALWQGKKVTLAQPYYPLVDAESYPLPPGGRVPLIIGARGERRTLKIAAAYADEWNVTRVTFDDYTAKRRVLESHCTAAGRDPGDIARSLMVPVITGRTAVESTGRLERARQIFPRVPADEAAWRAAGFLYGTPERVVADLKRWEALGVQRVMLQMLDMDDTAAIELLAREVVPACR